MATKLQGFPTKAEGDTRYPWADYEDGDVWEVKQGEDGDPTADFTISVESFRTLLHNRAKTQGKTVKTKKVDDVTLAFQFLSGNTASV